MKEQKPIKPFKIDPTNFLNMIESFIKSYPQYSWDIKKLSENGEKELEKLNFTDTKGLDFEDKEVNYRDFKPFWDRYLTIEDIEFSGDLIKNAVFQQIKPLNHNAIFKTAGKQNLSYSLVVSKVGIKIELLIKTLRKDIKDKSKFNKIIFDEIKKHKTELDKKVKNLVWERLDNPERVYSRIYFIIAKCSLNNKSIHPRLGINDISGTKKESIFSKMAEASDKFYRAFDPVIKKIDIKKMEKKL